MTNPDVLHTQIAALLLDRMYAVFDEDQEAANEWLTSLLGSARAAALTELQMIRMTPDERLSLCTTLWLYEPLVSDLLAGASAEVRDEHLRALFPAGEPHCEECDALAQACWAGGEDRDDLAIAVLEHIWAEPDGDFGAASERESDLLRVFGTLSPAAQLRVLAHAYEQREHDDARAAAESHATTPFARLLAFREEYLTPPLRHLLDTLIGMDEACSPEELSVRMGIDAIDVMARAAKVTAAQQQLIRDCGDDRVPIILIVGHTDEGHTLRLHPLVAEAWALAAAADFGI